MSAEPKMIAQVKPRLTRQAQAAYIEGGGVRCPFCGKDNLEGGSFNSECCYSWQNVNCVDCGSEWQDVFQIAFLADKDDGEPLVDGFEPKNGLF